MELWWANYRGKKNRTILFLYLGEAGGKVVGLETEYVTPGDAAVIKASSRELDGLSLDRRLKWVKRYCPNSYRTAVRTIHSANLHLLDKYQINKL